MAYYDFLNVVFSPLLKLPAVLAVLVLALVISLVIILITKYTTNQPLMKKLKEEIQNHQKQIKESRNNPSKAMELQKKAMEVNMKYMMHSLRPTIITFIPIILIFGWMSSIFAYESIHPQQEFSITAFFQNNAAGESTITVPDGIDVIGNKTAKIESYPTGLIFQTINKKATWTLKGKEGEYTVEVDFNGEKQQKILLITDTDKYIEPVKRIADSQIKSIQIDYASKKLLNLYFFKLNWLWAYILFSIIFTMALRKILKVY